MPQEETPPRRRARPNPHKTKTCSSLSRKDDPSSVVLHSEYRRIMSEVRSLTSCRRGKAFSASSFCVRREASRRRRTVVVAVVLSPPHAVGNRRQRGSKERDFILPRVFCTRMLFYALGCESKPAKQFSSWLAIVKGERKTESCKAPEQKDLEAVSALKNHRGPSTVFSSPVKSWPRRNFCALLPNFTRVFRGDSWVKFGSHVCCEKTSRFSPRCQAPTESASWLRAKIKNISLLTPWPPLLLLLPPAFAARQSQGHHPSYHRTRPDSMHIFSISVFPLSTT